MSGWDFVNVWEVCEENGWISEYLYENHFFMRVWKEARGVGIERYGKVIRLLIKRGEVKEKTTEEGGGGGRRKEEELIK